MDSLKKVNNKNSATDCGTFCQYVCWFLAKHIANFLSHSFTLDTPYSHNARHILSLSYFPLVKPIWFPACSIAHIRTKHGCQIAVESNNLLINESLFRTNVIIIKDFEVILKFNTVRWSNVKKKHNCEFYHSKIEK